MTIRTAVLGMIFSVGLLGAAAAEDTVKLFKIVSQKDDIVIGLTKAEMEPAGNGELVAYIARKLAADGQITVWQYAVGRDASGQLQQAPRARVAILRSDTLRIEPYASPLPIVAPGK